MATRCTASRSGWRCRRPMPRWHRNSTTTIATRCHRSGSRAWRPAVLIAGSAYGECSPVKVFAPMFFLEVSLEAGAELALPAEHAERGVLVVEGAVRWGVLEIGAAQMAVQTGSSAPPLRALEASRLMLFGGAPLDGECHLWWNFVASTRERIEQAKADWREGRFPKVSGDDKEFIPLPE